MRGEDETAAGGAPEEAPGWRRYGALALVGAVVLAMLAWRMRSNSALEARLAGLREEVAELEQRLEPEPARARAAGGGPLAGSPVAGPGPRAGHAVAPSPFEGNADGGVDGGEPGPGQDLPPVELAADAAAMGAKYAALRRLMEDAHDHFGGGRIVAYGSDERRDYDAAVEEFTLMATEMAMSMQQLKGLGDGDAESHAEFLASAMVDALDLGEAGVRDLHGALADGMGRREAAKAEHAGDDAARDAALGEIEDEISAQIESVVGAEGWKRLVELFGEGMLSSVSFSMPVPPGNEAERESYRAHLEAMKAQAEGADGRRE